jgi:hypothetical protein
LKPNCDILLSTSAFKFNLHRYISGYDATEDKLGYDWDGASTFTDDGGQGGH